VDGRNQLRILLVFAMAASLAFRMLVLITGFRVDIQFPRLVGWGFSVGHRYLQEIVIARKYMLFVFQECLDCSRVSFKEFLVPLVLVRP